jgi:hypothetical protein
MVLGVAVVMAAMLVVMAAPAMARGFGSRGIANLDFSTHTFTISPGDPISPDRVITASPGDPVIPPNPILYNPNVFTGEEGGGGTT